MSNEGEWDEAIERENAQGRTTDVYGPRATQPFDEIAGIKLTVEKLSDRLEDIEGWTRAVKNDHPAASSPEINELATALAKAQVAFGKIKKTATAHVISQKGNFAYDYATLADALEAIREHLGANGLSVVQRVVRHEEKRLSLSTLLLHQSGQWIEADYPIQLDEGGRMNKHQQLGSAVTYARRYSLLAMVGLAPEDEDTASIVAGDKKPAGKSKPKQQERPATAEDKQRQEWIAWGAKFVENVRAVKTAAELDELEVTLREKDGEGLNNLEKLNAVSERAAQRVEEVLAETREDLQQGA